MKLTKHDRSQKITLPIYLERDVLQLGLPQHAELDDCTIEMDQDDDIDTDDDVLCSGIEQCHADLRDLRRFVRNTKHFRAETAVVTRWKRRGFAFNESATSVLCTINHNTNIFWPKSEFVTF